MRRLLASVALTLGLILPSFLLAQESGERSLQIEAPWARASIGPAKAGAAYATFANHGYEVERLIAVETPVAKHAAVHTHMMEDGVMKMRPVGAIEIAAGEPTVLRPGGLHIMLMGLEAPLIEGESFPLTLIFERAGRIDIEVGVEGATANEPGSAAPADRGESQGHDHSS